MQTVHNPDRYIADLRQILSQGRKRIGFLVGAGAPLSIRVDGSGRLDNGGHSLIPGVDALTNQVIESLSDENRKSALALIADLGGKPNIEDILSRVRLLQQALGRSTVHGLDGDGYNALGKAMCTIVGDIVGPQLPKSRNAYNEIVTWISGTARTSPVEIFTTNYDLLFEEAFEMARAPYFDGFSGGKSPFFDPVTVSGNDLPPRWSRLWKLHGSLGWKLENGSVIRGSDRSNTELIYPDHLKYDLTQKQPYSSLFERLRTFLNTPDTILLTVGFSFRDAHICAVLEESLAVNSNSAVFAFQYGDLENEKGAVSIALDRPNLSVYAADGAVIGGIDGPWQPGEIPKNWKEIRASFWADKTASSPAMFVLGDFVRFTRFCSQAQSVDLKPTRIEGDLEEPAEAADTVTAE